MTTRFFPTRLMKLALVAIVTALTGTAAAAEYYKTAGKLAVYLGVLPAEMVQGHSPEHPEGKMHGGVPSPWRLERGRGSRSPEPARCKETVQSKVCRQPDDVCTTT